MDFRRTWTVIKPHLPAWLFALIVRVYRPAMQFWCWYTGLGDPRNTKRAGFTSLPGASLRYRVHGTPEIESFLRVGRQCYQDLEAALARHDRKLASFQNILDFGCGCGRTLLWLQPQAQTSQLYGTDIDSQAIAWCQHQLDFATFSLNSAAPPLSYSAEKFDLIYAISVFTHLDEAVQFLWLEELKRIVKPGGLLLLTVQGQACWKNLQPKLASQVTETGFLFIASNVMQGIFPDWYQETYHTQAYVLDRYSRYFEILDYLPQGLNRHQDLVLLKKPA
jgi:ubiquinone/menaquinone biosynthesis C-methylase UbiE